MAVHALEGGLVHSYSCAMLDWEALREALQAALLEAVSAEAGGPWRVAALGEVYAESDGIIEAPLLFLNDDVEDMESPGDWQTVLDNWAPEPWIKALTAEACAGTVAHWEDIFARYRDLLAQICVAAGARLNIPVFYVEHGARYEEMLARCLNPAQLRSLFPEVVARQAERARVSALLPGEQIAYYVSRLNRFDGLIDGEEAERALRGFGAAAIPALLPLLRQDEHAWLAAKLLADIGIPDDTVISALSAALAASAPDSPDLWLCSALAQLDRLDLVLARASELPREAVVTAVTARYTAFRDQGAHPLVLDYRPLEELLSENEAIAPAIAEELKPGRSYCVISAAEVPEALRGTTSTHVLVRKHAVCVLGERRLGDAVGRVVIPRLRAIAETDTDSEVRRLAALSLKWWKAER
jgi:hypothetical protein